MHCSTCAEATPNSRTPEQIWAYFKNNMLGMALACQHTVGMNDPRARTGCGSITGILSGQMVAKTWRSLGERSRAQGATTITTRCCTHVLPAILIFATPDVCTLSLLRFLELQKR